MFHQGRIPIFSSSQLNGVSSIGKNTFKAENNQRKCITAQFHNNLWTSFGRSKCDFSRMTIFRMLTKYSMIIRNERGEYSQSSKRITLLNVRRSYFPNIKLTFRSLTDGLRFFVILVNLLCWWYILEETWEVFSTEGLKWFKIKNSFT